MPAGGSAGGPQPEGLHGLQAGVCVRQVRHAAQVRRLAPHLQGETRNASERQGALWRFCSKSGASLKAADLATHVQGQLRQQMILICFFARGKRACSFNLHHAHHTVSINADKFCNLPPHKPHVQGAEQHMWRRWRRRRPTHACATSAFIIVCSLLPNDCIWQSSILGQQRRRRRSRQPTWPSCQRARWCACTSQNRRFQPHSDRWYKHECIGWQAGG